MSADLPSTGQGAEMYYEVTAVPTLVGNREPLLGIIGRLMVVENEGDVHEVIDRLCGLVGIPKPEGNHLDGWTAQDWERVRQESQEPAAG